jgi:hypothetical protein
MYNNSAKMKIRKTYQGHVFQKRYAIFVGRETLLIVEKLSKREENQ